MGSYLLGFLEVRPSSVRCVDTVERQISTSVAGRVAIASDLTSLALVASDSDVPAPFGSSLISIRRVVAILTTPLVSEMRSRWRSAGGIVVRAGRVLTWILTTIHHEGRAASINRQCWQRRDTAAGTGP